MKKITKAQTIKKLKSVNLVSYYHEVVYTDIRNIVTDYMNDSQDFSCEELFNDFIDSELVEGEIAHILADGQGLQRIKYFLGDCHLNNDIFILDGYGNLRDLELSDIKNLIDEIINTLSGKYK